MPEQIRIRAIFDDFDSLKSALGALKQANLRDYEAYGPTNLEDLADLMPKKGSPVRIWATVGAIIGLIAFWWMCVASALLYSLITGGKPPWSNIPFVIPAYEGTILLGAIGVFAAIIHYARLARRPLSLAYDTRFSGDAFGIVVRATKSDTGRVTGLLQQSGATEVTQVDEVPE
jgi:hypothetical protein